MTDILTEQNFICNVNVLVISDLQGRIREILIVQILTQKTLQKVSWANYLFPQLRHLTNLNPTPPSRRYTLYPI